MLAVFRRVRTAARAVVRIVLRVIRIVLILALVFLPLPVTALVVVLFKGERRDVPAEVLRKE